MQREMVVDILSAEMAGLQDQKSRLDAEMDNLRSQVADLEKKIEHFSQVLVHFGEKGDAEGVTPTPTNGRTQTDPKLTDHLYQMLKDVGHPMHRRNLYKNLQALGIHVAGDHPVNNMTAHMSQDGRFESKGAGEWGLAEWTRPTASRRGGPIYPTNIRRTLLSQGEEERGVI